MSTSQITLTEKVAQQFTDLSPEPNEADQVLSAKSLRLSVGIVGFALPVVLFASNWTFGDHELPGSMSAFYYTPMRNYFVGTMCALGVFLFSYRYSKKENTLSTLAAVMAVVVGLCPTAPEGAHHTGWNILHLLTAWLFLILVGYFALRYFPRSDPNVPRPENSRKPLRNNIYRACGIVTIASMVAAALLLPVDSIHILFWLETVAVWAFSFAWIVKGGWFFTDPKPARLSVPLDEPAPRSDWPTSDRRRALGRDVVLLAR